MRPLALSPDGNRLFAVNTPDNHLEIFDVAADAALTHSATVAVGLEPVAVAPRSNTKVWVLNHLSDSVSIVDVSGTPRVVRTLLVGDEPRDILFAGPGSSRAFITTAHRGQNTPINMAVDLITPGTGRADVWVFDATNLGATLVPPNPGTSVQAFFAIGGGDLHCAKFGGTAGGIFSPDTAKLLRVKGVQAEGTCP